MQDNFTNETNIEQLNMFMDGDMPAAELTQLEQLIAANVNLQDRLENLQLAKSAIKSLGMQQRIQALHTEYMATTKATATVIKPNFGSTVSKVFRIAAVFVVVLLTYGIYQFSTTNTNNVFNDNYMAYQLPVNRGAETIATIDGLYKSNNYTAVIANFTANNNKQQKDYFLAALSYLQTDNAAKAIENFSTLQQLNSKSNDKYFVEETDYYLALAYIKAGNITAAKKQLDIIKGNKQHLFYQKASEISPLTLTMLTWKQ